MICGDLLSDRLFPSPVPWTEAEKGKKDIICGDKSALNQLSSIHNKEM